MLAEYLGKVRIQFVQHIIFVRASFDRCCAQGIPRLFRCELSSVEIHGDEEQSRHPDVAASAYRIVEFFTIQGSA